MQLIQKPRLAVFAGLIILGVAVVTTYQYTKAAYHAVGLNDGAIDSDTRMLKRFTEIVGTIPVCTNKQQHEGKVIVAVKAESIYAIARGPDTISLCLAR